jgi:DNA-binding winged helix-turn-helix (wHTH) protein
MWDSRGLVVGWELCDRASALCDMDGAITSGVLTFGDFELDVEAEELRRQGKRVKLQPQPFKVLLLLASHAGRPVSRDEIRRHLWPEGTFVDFDQGVNFCIKQIRDALHDGGEHGIYIETIPRRGYRFRVPVAVHKPGAHPSIGTASGGTTMRLQKILWTNIAELRMAEARRHRYTLFGIGLLIAVLAMLTVLVVLK